jgi:hypothetical protein
MKDPIIDIMVEVSTNGKMWGIHHWASGTYEMDEAKWRREKLTAYFPYTRLVMVTTHREVLKDEEESK